MPELAPQSDPEENPDQAPATLPPMLSVRKHFRGRIPVLKQLLQTSYGREVYDRMLIYIRLGCADGVAAIALGITPRTFSNWMRKGQDSKYKRSMFRKLFLDVREAQARARLMREMQLSRQNPLAWLRVGPGKKKLWEEDEGWKDPDSGSTPAPGETLQDIIEEGQRAPISESDTLEALEELERLGILTLNRDRLPPRIEDSLSSPTNGNGQE